MLFFWMKIHSSKQFNMIFYKKCVTIFHESIHLLLDPRVLEAWAPVAEARITRVRSGGQLLASRSQKACEDRQNPSMKEYSCLFE